MLVVGVLGHGLVDPDRPVVAADDLGLTRGDGCFEGLRVQRLPDGPVIDKLDAHLTRLRRSASALDLPVDEDGIRALLAQAIRRWVAIRPQATEAAVKLMLTRGRSAQSTSTRPTGMVTVSAIDGTTLAARRNGVSVATLRRGVSAAAFGNAPWLLGGVKTLSYAVNVAALREADRRGAQDVIFLADDGSVLEAPTAAVVWVTAGTLCTVAPGANGILAGTTQQLLFDHAAALGWRTAEGTGTLADLRGADSVLLVSSVRGPVAVTVLDGEPLPHDRRIVAQLQQLAGFPAAATTEPAGTAGGQQP